jgi:hypothetical protein
MSEVFCGFGCPIQQVWSQFYASSRDLVRLAGDSHARQKLSFEHVTTDFPNGLILQSHLLVYPS